MYLPKLAILDGFHVDESKRNALGGPNSATPKSAPPYYQNAAGGGLSDPHNYHHMTESPTRAANHNPLTSTGHMPLGQKQHLNTTAAIVALQNSGAQKDTIIGKLHEQVRQLTAQYEHACTERD